VKRDVTEISGGGSERSNGKGGGTSARSRDVREAALTLFAERGYHGTTMNDIARTLGVRAPSLYNHIGSKQELLQGIIFETMEGVIADFEDATVGVEDTTERLRHATEVYVLRHARYRREALVVNREVSALGEQAGSRTRDKQAEHARLFRSLIEEGRASGQFHVESSTLATFAILEMAVAVARWFRDEGPMTAAEVARQYGEFAVRMVGSTGSGVNSDTE